MIRLIGIVGRKRSGKDTLFSYLRQLLKVKHLNAYRFAFADELKREVSKATGVPLHLIEQHKDQFRPILQWWGTDFRRQYCMEDYWLPAFQAVFDSTGSNTFVIVTDVRFQNEADLIKKNGGILVGIERRPAWQRNRWFSILCGGQDNHLSEAESDRIQVDHFIDNSGGPDELLEAAQDLLFRLDS